MTRVRRARGTISIRDSTRALYPELLEAKRVTSVVGKLDKDLALRMEKSAVQQKAQRRETENNREQRANKPKDAAVREASRKEAERDLTESTLRALRELEERRKEKENIRLAEERRMERCTAVSVQWSHLRRKMKSRSWHWLNQSKGDAFTSPLDD